MTEKEKLIQQIQEIADDFLETVIERAVKEGDLELAGRGGYVEGFVIYLIKELKDDK